MKELELLEQELKSMLNNIDRIRDFKMEYENKKWKPYHSNVVGELKHRIVVLKQTLTRASKITTYNLFE
jgi:protoheme ferro-lyase